MDEELFLTKFLSSINILCDERFQNFHTLDMWEQAVAYDDKMLRHIPQRFKFQKALNTPHKKTCVEVVRG